jgi:hypothetical protein
MGKEEKHSCGLAKKKEKKMRRKKLARLKENSEQK